MGDNGKMRSGIVQLATRQISRQTLENVRATLSFDENAVLISHSYLGRMTQTEYETGEIKVPSVLLNVLMIITVAAIAVTALKLL
ncbi:MAG TPA: hypothetical protein DEF80_09525 [Pantoea sp.]|nr:hypothetical protein [Pantoea sp.]